jgi:hypothetical protein
MGVKRDLSCMAAEKVWKQVWRCRRKLQQTTAPVGRVGVLSLVRLKRGAVYAEEQMLLREESGEASLYVDVVKLPC